MKNKLLLPLFTVCIPTCYGGDSLVKAAQSIRIAFGKDTPCIIASDTVPLGSAVKKQLKLLNITVIENKKPGSQISKIKQMLTLVKTEYVIFTQDDITISANTETELTKFLMSEKKLTMFSIRNIPTKAKSYVDYALTSGTDMAYYIEIHWNNGRNFLRGCGRFLGFNTAHMKKFHIPNDVVNVDAYFYFENKRLNGVFDRCESAFMYYVLPNNLKEQIKKSSRYQYCYEEMQRNFGSVGLEFSIPSHIKIQALIVTCIKNPMQFFSYIPLLITTRLFKEKKNRTKDAIWSSDLSTK